MYKSTNRVCVRDRVRMCVSLEARVYKAHCVRQPGNINKNNRHQTKDHATRRVTRIRYVNRLCSLSGMLLSSEFTCFFFCGRRFTRTD